MLYVGLTGGTGSGKSTLAQAFAECGGLIIDADALAREVVAPGTPGLAQIAERFGPEMLDEAGALRRTALAGRVFSDAGELHALEAITHPLIEARTAELVAQAPAGSIVVHDMPLIVERGNAADYHLVIVVDAPSEQRVERLVRRGLTAEDARRRIAVQATTEQRRRVSDIWIDNTDAAADLALAGVRLFHDRLEPFAANLVARRRAPRPERLALRDPDPTWPVQAARCLARIERAAGEPLRSAEHIGSTSVPGLPAKDVIDLQVVVDDLPTARRVGDNLARIGLVPLDEQWWDEVPDLASDLAVPPTTTRAKVFCGSADPGRAVNVHIRDAANPFAQYTLVLRDRLRADPAAAAAYADLKRGLLTADPDLAVEEYARAKTPFIVSVLRHRK